jgi:hypothetical protein
MRPATVAICDVCWLIEEGGRDPVRFKFRMSETCYRCQQETHSGIYVRRMIPTNERKTT